MNGWLKQFIKEKWFWLLGIFISGVIAWTTLQARVDNAEVAVQKLEVKVDQHSEFIARQDEINRGLKELIRDFKRNGR